MSQEETKAVFEKQVWAKGDRPGASAFNRIEDGIESAHGRIDALERVVADSESAQAAVNSQALTVSFSLGVFSEIVKQIPKLEANAKVADVVQAFNALHDALTGHVESEAGHGGQE